MKWSTLKGEGPGVNCLEKNKMQEEKGGPVKIRPIFDYSKYPLRPLALYVGRALTLLTKQVVAFLPCLKMNNIVDIASRVKKWLESIKIQVGEGEDEGQNWWVHWRWVELDLVQMFPSLVHFNPFRDNIFACAKFPCRQLRGVSIWGYASAQLAFIFFIWVLKKI